MKTLEELRRRIGSVEDMQSVVSTMKSLAAARIRQFETAADATRAYSYTVNLALQILMRDQKPPTKKRQHRTGERMGLVLLGSDQGFCGRFNESVAQAAIQFSPVSDNPTVTPHVLVVGSRLNQLIVTSDLTISRTLHVPSSVSDITSVIQEVIPQIERWQREFEIPRVELFYNQRRSAATYELKQLQLMPLSRDFMDQLGKQDWPSRSLPIYHLPWRDLFTLVVRQYLFLQLFRACAESLASENASRIAAMQQAEKNIDQRLNELSSQFNQNRQRAITEELLDIISGFEAVTDTEA